MNGGSNITHRKLQYLEVLAETKSQIRRKNIQNVYHITTDGYTAVIQFTSNIYNEVRFRYIPVLHRDPLMVFASRRGQENP